MKIISYSCSQVLMISSFFQAMLSQYTYYINSTYICNTGCHNNYTSLPQLLTKNNDTFDNFISI